MKRTTWLLIAMFLLVFAALSLRRRSRDVETSRETTGAAEHTRAFWETYQKATAFRMEGRYEAAEASYRRALDFDPAHQDSLFYLAVTLESRGRYPEAARVLRDLTALHPEHGRAWSQLGALLATKAPGGVADFEGAEQALLRSEAINSEHSGPFVARGKLALDEGRLDDASRLFRIASDMGSPEGMFYAGLIAYLRDADVEAFGVFSRVFAKHARERAIGGKGASSEGDVVESEWTPLDRAYLRSRLFAYWSSRRTGGYPADIAADDRVTLRSEKPRLRVHQVSGNHVLADLDGDGRPEVVWCTPEGLRSSGEEGVIAPAAVRDVVAFDADGDGALDLYGIGGGFYRAGNNVLLRNEGARFADVTGPTGLSGERATSRVVAADFDGDGSSDLLEVGSVGPNGSSLRLFLRREERYEERATALGLVYQATAVDAVVADFDADGRLDVFVLGWRAPGRLFRAAESRFVDVTRMAGLEDVGGDGLRALAFDPDGDGDLDLLVSAHASLDLSIRRLLVPQARAKDETPRLLRNDGQGRFADATHDAALDRHYGIFDVAAADVDGDGWLDLLFALGGFEADHIEPSVVLRNVDGGYFVQWAHLPGIDRPLRATRVSAGDLDGDGVIEVVLSIAGRGLP